jgi:UPF0755 protein
LIRVVTQSLKIVSILVVAIAVIGGSVAFFNYWTDRTSSAEVGRPVTIEITASDDTGSVAKKLTKAKLVKYGFYFEIRMRLGGGDLQPGVYTIPKGDSVAEIIKRITVKSSSSDTGSTSSKAPTAIKMTFIEGQRIGQFADQFNNAGFSWGSADFMKAASNPANRKGFSFLDGLPANASLEGFLFPDTYTFGSNATPDQVVQLMLEDFQTRFDASMLKAQKSSGLSMLQVVTIASIVEREAAVPEERPIIAKVYINRVNDGMLLNADPTLQYFSGKEGDWWPKITDAIIATDNPYNTYKVVGLPPGPISNPSLASLQAVLNPANVTYLYFVAKDDGSQTHAFADTIDEQNANTCTYQGTGCGGSSTSDGTGSSSDTPTATVPPDGGN